MDLTGNYALDLAKTFGLSLAATGGMFAGILVVSVAYTEYRARKTNKTFTEIIDNNYTN